VRGLGSFGVEGELTIFQGEEAVIADGHAKDVGSQRLAGVRAGAHRFKGPTQACSQTAGGTRSTTRGFRGAARSLARNVTERALTGTRKSSVDRGMIVHRPGPGGPHPDPPDCAADKPRIAGERSEGRC
jgi:hypothetical protein